MKNNSKVFARREFLTVAAKAGAVAVTVGTAGCASTTAATASAASAKALRGANDEITQFSALELSALIKSRAVSCVEVMLAYLDRIDEYNPTYNAIVSLRDRSELLSEANQADVALINGEYRGWMHGMPHAVKDLSDVVGMITTSGSPILKNNIAKADAIFVERIRQQGAIFIGKTNVPEFGLGSQSYNNVFGVTRNAYNPELCAGGSSGGAAVGLATHMLPVADGSDMMGSLRNPAAYNNVIGFRPSFGRVPAHGSMLFFQQLGLEGPMGRNVADTRKLFETMAGYNAHAPLSMREELGAPNPEQQLSRYKVAWMGDYNGYLPTEPGVLEICSAALAGLERNGLKVEAAVPDFDMATLWQTWLTFRHWIIAAGAKGLYDNPELKKLLKPEVVWEVEGGLEQTGLGLSAAAKDRSDWYKSLVKMFEKFDFLISPTAQVFAFDAQEHWPKQVNGKEMDTYHRWMEVVIGGTLAGCPTINLPVGFDQRGRAMGIQVMAGMGEDAKLLDFAASYEANTNFLSVRPNLVVT